jgi:hypothetical protein
MSKRASSSTHAVTVSPQSELMGLRVLGFHGQVDAAHTPARRAPILADEEGWLVRLLVPETLGDTADSDGPRHIQVERGSLQVQEGQPLPGVGTRLGPWLARLGYTVVLLGESEQRHATRLSLHVPRAKVGVTALIDWLALGRPQPAPERVASIGALVAWYCSEAEAYSLWSAILREARLALLHAFGHQPPASLEEPAWWLSRAALSDDDLYLAAACLKHAGSPHAEAMLRTMLSKPLSPAELQERMSEQLLFLDAHARLAPQVQELPHSGAPAPPADPVLASVRERVRNQSRMRSA